MGIILERKENDKTVIKVENILIMMKYLVKIKIKDKFEKQKIIINRLNNLIRL